MNRYLVTSHRDKVKITCRMYDQSDARTLANLIKEMSGNEVSIIDTFTGLELE